MARKLKYSTQPARHSHESAFAFRVVYIDYQRLGTHEEKEPDAEKPVYDSMLARGYFGPLIAVFQAQVDTLFNAAGPRTHIDHPYGEIGVADGHHRYKAIQRLAHEGLLKSEMIPVQLIAAHKPEIILICTLTSDEAPLAIEEIEACFVDPSKAIPICSSHFQTRLSNGNWVRLQEAQPDVIIAKADFLK
jgi:hypothetical protein